VNAEEIMGLVVIIALILGWRITWLATRVDRANARAERTWEALDAALVRRAQRALELVLIPDIDPATALLVSDAAAAALEPDLSRRDRERAESDLSHLLDAVVPTLSPSPSGLESERARASRAPSVRNGRWSIRTLTAGPPDSPPSSLAYVRLAVYAAEPRAPAVGEAANRHSASGRELGWPCDR